MSTLPRFLSLDLATHEDLVDTTPARAATLREMVRHQHSLMSRWGGPAQARSMCVEASGGATVTKDITYRVPPGVTHVNVSALIHGRGTVTFTTAVDTTGTTLRANVYGTTTPVEDARWYSTSGTGDDDSTAESGRALQVRSNAAWSWSDVTIEIEADDTSGDDLLVLGLVVRPLHVSRTAPDYSEVTAYYSSPGAVGDYAEATGFDVLFTGSGATAGAVAFWVRAAVGADASTVTLFEASDDGSPSLRATYGGNELAAQITDDTNTLIAEDILNGNTDGEWHHILVAPRADPTLVGDDIVPTADGVIIYIDGTNPTDGNVDSGTYATATSVLRLFARHDGSDRLAGDIANFAVFSSCPDITELSDLVAAGVRHDVRNPTGEWRGYHPAVYYRTAAAGGVVANSGSDTGTSGLTLNGSVTSEAL